MPLREKCDAPMTDGGRNVAAIGGTCRVSSIGLVERIRQQANTQSDEIRLKVSASERSLERTVW